VIADISRVYVRPFREFEVSYIDYMKGHEPIRFGFLLFSPSFFRRPKTIMIFVIIIRHRSPAHFTVAFTTGYVSRTHRKTTSDVSWDVTHFLSFFIRTFTHVPVHRCSNIFPKLLPETTYYADHFSAFTFVMHSKCLTIGR
jgi:hypothetical protein